MEYSVEEVSPVKKKITIQVAPEEVAAALGGAVALLKQEVQLDGFRKGKVPNSVIEKRFHENIEKDAKENLINVHINEIVQKIGSRPVSAITMSGEDKPLVKGEPFQYSMEFEVMPKFDIPGYEGLEVEEKVSKANEEIVDSVMERYMQSHSKLVPVSGTAPASDGQVANIDFEAYEDGKKLEQFTATNFDMTIGANEALKEFEDIVKTIPVGHTGEGQVRFPEDFIAPEVAGKTLTLKITVHSVKEPQQPTPDDTLAKKAGYKDLADMRASMGKAYEQGMANLNKAEAQQDLLVRLVKQTDFPLPRNMVNAEINLLIGDFIHRMERVGKNPIRSTEDLEKLKTSMREQGEAFARKKILLLAIANKENLEVTPEEIHVALRDSSQKMGVDFKTYVEKMEDSGMIFQFRDNMLCDKAMDLIYARAKVTPVEDKPDVKAAEENSGQESAE